MQRRLSSHDAPIRRPASSRLSALVLTCALAAPLGTAGEPPSAAGLDPAIKQAFEGKSLSTAIIHTEGGDVEQIEGRIRVIVKLKQPAGMSFRERGPAGLEEIKAAVSSAQQSFLQRLGDGGLRVSRRMSLQPVVAGHASRAAIEQMLTLPDVESIEPDYLLYPQTVEGRSLSRSDVADSALGARGAGVTVADIDTGFDYTHPDLGIATPRNESCPSCANPVVLYMKDFANGDDNVFPPDCNAGYHGTGTAGIVRKYAPDARLVLLKVFSDSSGGAYISDIAEAVDWTAAHKNDVTPPIELITMSIGGGKYGSDCASGAIQRAFDNARAAGIIPFVAAGNDGYMNALASPGCDPDVISVGSVFDADNCAYDPFPPAYCYDSHRQANERICYSNASGSLDIYAPSEDVITATAFSCDPSGYRSLGGTSSATPAACGAAAQILSARPSLKGDKDALLSLMQATGDEIINNPNPAYQSKRINVQAAVEFNGASPVVNSFTASPSPVAPGGTVTLAWSCANTARVTISGVAGSFGSSSYATVTPAATTIYTLTATGPGGTASAIATATVNVTGAGLALTPSSAEFGHVAPGSTSLSKTFEVHNTGTTNLEVGMLLIGGANPMEFSIQSDNASGETIPPSAIRTFEVVFAPASDGVKSAGVTVPSTAGSTVAMLSGSGSSGMTDLTGSWAGLRRQRKGALDGQLQVKNAGAGSADRFTVNIYLSKNDRIGRKDKLIKSVTIRLLRAGSIKSIPVSTVATSSWLYIIAKIDANDDVIEHDETNNIVLSQTPGAGVAY